MYPRPAIPAAARGVVRLQLGECGGPVTVRFPDVDSHVAPAHRICTVNVVVHWQTDFNPIQPVPPLGVTRPVVLQHRA